MILLTVARYDLVYQSNKYKFIPDSLKYYFNVG